MHPRIDGYAPTDLPQPTVTPATVTPTHAPSSPVVASEPGTAAYTDAARAEWVDARQRLQDAPPHVLPQASSEAHRAEEAFAAAVRAELEQAPPFIGPVTDVAARIEATAAPTLRRLEGDPAAVEVARGVVTSLQAEAPASQRPAVTELLDAAGAQPDAQGVVDTLSAGLAGLSESDRTYLTTSPELATLLREKVEPWVSEYYRGFDGDLSQREAIWPANQSAQRLATLTDGLPPDLAYAVVQGNLDTIINIAQLRPMYLGPIEKFGGTSFGDVSRAVATLGDTPAGNQLRSDIATLFTANGVERGQGIPLASALADPVRQGISPGLALEIMDKLQATGETEVAAAAANYLVEAGDTLADGIGQDLEEYQSMLGELGTLLNNHNGLSADATEAAVQDWLDGQSDEWQAEFEALEGRLVERAEVMRELLAGVSALPEDIRAQTDDVDGKLRDLFNRDEVLNAVNLAASRDRTFLEGPQADLMIGLADPARATAAGGDALQRIGNHAIQQQATTIFANLDHGNPASVANAKAQLQALGDRVAGVFGGDADAYRSAITQLEQFADLPQNATPAQAAQVAARMNTSLNGLDGFQANTPVGTLFRSLGVAAGVLAVNKYASLAIDEPSLRDTIATIGGAAALGQGVISLLQRPGTVDLSASGALDDARGRLGPLGAANWGRALGVFSAAGDIAYMADAIGRGENVEAGLHALAGVGTVVLSVSSGPIGALVGAGMIAISMFGQSSLAAHRDQQAAHAASYDFLVAAGLEPDVARILADTGETEGGPAVPAVPLIMDAARFGGLTGHRDERLTPEQTVDALNAMSGDQAQLDELRAQVNNLRYANQHVLMQGGG